MAITYKERRAPASDLADVSDPLIVVARTLAASAKDVLGHVSVGKLTKALHRAIDGPSTEAGKTRAMLQLHLARVGVAVLTHTDAQVPAVEMISTTEAAKILGCSRPHVAMLIDGGKLPGSLKSEGGHRQAPMAAVLALKKEREAAARTAPADSDYQAAGIAAGIYDIPEDAWMGVAKRGR